MPETEDKIVNNNNKKHNCSWLHRAPGIGYPKCDRYFCNLSKLQGSNLQVKDF